MSVSSSIDIKLAPIVSPINIITKLLEYGWTPDDNGIVSYLPLGDVDSYEWKRENIKFPDLLEIIKEKMQGNETIGVVLTWKDTGIGGEFLFWNDGSVSINLSIRRKLIDSISNITDVNWYLTKLITALNVQETKIVSITYEEHV